MIILGTLLGGTVSLVRLLSNHAFEGPPFVLNLVFGVLLLPFGWLPSTGFMFPFNGPLWSLFYEALANLAYGLWNRWVTATALITVMVVSALGIAYVAFTTGHLEVGAGKDLWAVTGGLSRVAFSFCAGVLLSRSEHRLKCPSMPAASLVTLVGLVLVSPLPGRDPLFDFVCVIAVFPIMMLAGIRSSVSLTALPICSFLGELSYSLYATHYPVMRIFLFIQEKKAWSGLRLWTSVGVEILACLTLAWLAMVFVDRPMRRRLSQSFGWRPVPQTGASTTLQ